jgi:HAD superfamily hydrolase (TIGR01509 family)
VHGLPPIKACTIVKEMFNFPDSAHDLAKEKAERARNLFAGNIKLIDGFSEFHNTIKDRMKMAVATNCNKQFVALADQEVRLSSFFNEHLYSIDMVENRSKPDPAIYLYAAARLEIEPKKCIAIEDSAAGIKAAKNAGMFCIGINTAHDVNNLKEADVIVQTFHEIKIDELIS